MLVKYIFFLNLFLHACLCSLMGHAAATLVELHRDSNQPYLFDFGIDTEKEKTNKIYPQWALVDIVTQPGIGNYASPTDHVAPMLRATPASQSFPAGNQQNAAKLKPIPQIAKNALGILDKSFFATSNATTAVEKAVSETVKKHLGASSTEGRITWGDFNKAFGRQIQNFYDNSPLPVISKEVGDRLNAAEESLTKNLDQERIDQLEREDLVQELETVLKRLDGILWDKIDPILIPEGKA